MLYHGEGDFNSNSVRIRGQFGEGMFPLKICLALRGLQLKIGTWSN
jgi:hypothetical protein